MQRKYALRKWTDGDWLCPSNDGQRVWRFRRYYEDGSLEDGMGGVVIGWFWEAYSVPVSEWDQWVARIYARPDVSDIDDLDWRTEGSLRPTRKAAIAVMEQRGGRA